MTAANSIPDRFRQVVQQHSMRPALRDDTRTITYRELDEWSDRIAVMVLERLGTGHKPVALAFDDGIGVVAALLGVLKAGHIYCVIDLTTPAARLTHILRDLAAELVLTDGAHAHLMHDAAMPPAEVIDVGASTEEQPLSELRVAIAASDLAAIYYTSGTTAKPKGVLRDHAGLLHRVQIDAEVCAVGPSDVVGLTYSGAYSASISDIFGALLSGATLCVYQRTIQNIAALGDWLTDQRITVLHLHATLLHQLLDTLPADRIFSDLRYGRPSDRTAVSDAQRLRRHLTSEAIIVHSLGSNETDLIARYVMTHATILDGEVLPVGRPVSSVDLTLLDGQDQPVTGAGVGEIVVRSRYLAPGYWRQEALTAQCFQTDPEDSGVRTYRTGDLARRGGDGLLTLVGRSDRRVKVRGHSVDLSYVEQMVAAQANVATVAVSVQGRRDRPQQLVAHVTLAGGVDAGSAVASLRDGLSRQLPPAMVPSRIVVTNRLPLLSNGKVDYRALPPPGTARPDLGQPFVAPRTELEQRFADLWADLLDLDEVGVDDDFFELGGDSLLAMRMVLASEHISSRVVPQEYFRQPTIAALARLCEADGRSGAVPPASSWARHGPGPRPSGRRLARLMAGQVAPRAFLRWAVRRSVMRLPHEQGLRTLAWLGQPRVANRLFRDERERFVRLARDLDNPAAASDTAFCANVVGNLVWQCLQDLRSSTRRPGADLVATMHGSPHVFWRSLADRIDHARVDERGHLFQVTGLEHLYHAQRVGRGTLLVTYHSPAAYLGQALLSRYTGLGGVLTISEVYADQLAGRELPSEDPRFTRRQSAWSATQALEGQRILRRGGVVKVVNDVAAHGLGPSVRKSLGGRLFHLKPGFAEMALLADATVVPMYNTFDAAGRIQLTFLPAFRSPAHTVAHADRVNQLLDQYVAFLEYAWGHAPESLGWGALRRYASCPPLREG